MVDASWAEPYTSWHLEFGIECNGTLDGLTVVANRKLAETVAAFRTHKQLHTCDGHCCPQQLFSSKVYVYMNCHLKDSHFCRSTCTLPHYHFTICAKVEATGITRDRGISEAGWRVHLVIFVVQLRAGHVKGLHEGL